MTHSLQRGVGAQSLLRRQTRVVDAALAVTAAGKVKGKIGQALRVRGVLPYLEGTTDEAMQALATAGDDLPVERFAHGIVIKGVSFPLGAQQMNPHGGLQMFLNRFDLLPDGLRQQAALEAPPNDGGSAQRLQRRERQARQTPFDGAQDAGGQLALDGWIEDPRRFGAAQMTPFLPTAQ